jgi:hypothetical protein
MMLKKFLDGLIFGAGFSLALVGTAVIASWLFFQPVVYTGGPKHTISRGSISKDEPPKQSALSHSFSQDFIPPEIWHEMPIEERIDKSSTIALARYEQGQDGRMQAIIKEFLKKDPDTTIYYDIGDEYSNSSYYPKDDIHHGDGVIIFFTGNPAQMRMSMSYSGNRIHSLADMPIELLRTKCDSEGAS